MYETTNLPKLYNFGSLYKARKICLIYTTLAQDTTHWKAIILVFPVHPLIFCLKNHGILLIILCYPKKDFNYFDAMKIYPIRHVELKTCKYSLYIQSSNWREEEKMILLFLFLFQKHIKILRF